MLRFWLNNARYNALPQSLLPAVTAIFMAVKKPSFSWQYSIIALLGVIFLHLSMNLFDDYFDYKKKGVEIRNKISACGIRARFGKCDYITSGKASINQLLIVSLLFAFLAIICGILIFLKQGWPILIIGIIGGILGISYSGNPVQLSWIWRIGRRYYIRALTNVRNLLCIMWRAQFSRLVHFYSGRVTGCQHRLYTRYHGF